MLWYNKRKKVQHGDCRYKQQESSHTKAEKSSKTKRNQKLTPSKHTHNQNKEEITMRKPPPVRKAYEIWAPPNSQSTDQIHLCPNH